MKLTFPVNLRETFAVDMRRLYLQHADITDLSADLGAAHIHIWELSDSFKNVLEMNKQKLETVC